MMARGLGKMFGSGGIAHAEDFARLRETLPGCAGVLICCVSIVTSTPPSAACTQNTRNSRFMRAYTAACASLKVHDIHV